jgi:uncharacterized membrane protein
MTGSEVAWASAGALAAIGAMTAATYFMRAAGFWAMGHVPLTRRVRKVLEALPGAVIVATVLPLAVKGGAPAWLGLGAAALAMIATRSPLSAVAAGAAGAALARLAGL